MRQLTDWALKVLDTVAWVTYIFSFLFLIAFVIMGLMLMDYDNHRYFFPSNPVLLNDFILSRLRGFFYTLIIFLICRFYLKERGYDVSFLTRQ